MLAEANLLENARYVEHATMTNQTVRRVADIDAAPYFSMILVHKRQDAWREQ